MTLIDIILLAIALGIDCFVVSFSQGLIFKNNRFKNSFNLALVMGFFQGFMPVIGYVGTNSLYKLIVPFSKWIVFGIFLTLGLKFIVDSFAPKEEQVQCIGWKCLCGLGIATSIDALAVGITFAFLNVNLILAITLIGIITFVLSFIGVAIGKKFGNKFKTKAEISGGAILILLGIKILLEHLGILVF